MDVERLIAGTREEVVTMWPFGQLVPLPATREHHFRQRPLASEDFHVPIDGRQREYRHGLLAVLENLVRREGRSKPVSARRIALR